MANSCLKTSWTASVISPRREYRAQGRVSRYPIYATLSGTGDIPSQHTDRPIVIKSPIPSKTPATKPEPAPIEHSSAYLLQTSKHKHESADELERRPSSDDEPFTGNAVEWMLKKVDESLDNVEENPPAYAKAIYEISTGPVGQATSKGAAAAAKMTVEVGSQALKAAAPVGKWMLKEGLKAAAGAVSAGVTSAIKSSSSKSASNRKDKK